MQHCDRIQFSSARKIDLKESTFRLTVTYVTLSIVESAFQDNRIDFFPFLLELPVCPKGSIMSLQSSHLPEEHTVGLCTY